MATFTKRDGKWRVQIRIKGVSRSATFTTKAAANAWALGQEVELQSAARGELPQKTWREALERYSNEVSPTKRGQRWEKIRINAFLNDMSFADRPITEVTTPVLAEWRDTRLKDVSPGTVSREMNLIGAILETARREWHWIRENPLRDVRRPVQPPARRRGVSPDEISRVLLALGYEEDQPITTKSQELALAFLLAIETAMRQGELLGLKWPQVFLDRRFVRLDKTKNGDAREVPLSTRAVALFQRLPRDHAEDAVFSIRGGSGGTAGTLFPRAVKAAGVDGLHFHDSRSEALTRLSKKLDVLQLARMVGHRDPRSLMFYYNETAETMASRLG